MHNLDRTQAEMYGETYEYGPAEFGYETNPEYTGEYQELPGEYQELSGEYQELPGEYQELPGEYQEMELAAEFGEYGEYTGELEFESSMSESLEMELAAELLEVSNEEELDRFLGKMFRGIGRVVRRVGRIPVFRQLGGILKGVARKALPMVGGALGTMVAPGLGTAIGGALGSMAGRMFEMELEGLSAEDQEFEVARRYVRLAASAAQRAAMAPPHVPPQIVAQRAFNAAARLYAPGLVNAVAPMAPRRRQASYRQPVAPYAVPGAAAMPYAAPMSGAVPPSAPAYAPGAPRRRPRTGRWVRQGRNVVLIGYYG